MRVENKPRLYHISLAVLWVATASFFLFWGLDYYVLSLEDRAYSPEHDLFKPTGLVGNRLGILGTLMIAVGVFSYQIRKRWKRLHGLGKLRNWLSFHIFLCTLGPFLIMLHTSFKVGGIVSIAFWSMVLVVTSGLVGRYVYVRIPKTLNGQFKSLADLQAQQESLLTTISDAAPSLDPTEIAPLLESPERPKGLLSALSLAVRFDLRARRQSRELRSMLVSHGVSSAVVGDITQLGREVQRIAQQRALLEPFGKIFRYWHTFHLPLAIIMALILLVHIGVAFAFGYAWTPSN